VAADIDSEVVVLAVQGAEVGAVAASIDLAVKGSTCPARTASVVLVEVPERQMKVLKKTKQHVCPAPIFSTLLVVEVQAGVPAQRAHCMAVAVLSSAQVVPLQTHPSEPLESRIVYSSAPVSAFSSSMSAQICSGA